MTKIVTGGHPELKMVNPRAAAIDIGSTMHMAAVNPDASDMPVRAFGTFTQDLHDLADWFKSCGVTSVAMESTGVYWIPAFEVLEGHGFQVILVNARYAKNVPGRKTDVSDAGWLRQLHSYGLLRGSFRPAAEISTLRAYLRQRERLVEYAAAHIQHMQKALMEMNLQLHHVVSDITGATGMRIIRAIVSGERDPEVLAAFRDIRCHSSIDVIKAAALLRLAATTIGRSDTALGAFYRRLSSRIGKQKAVTATARKIAVLFYNAVRFGMAYHDPGAAAYEERHRTRVLANLQRRAKTFGFELAPIPAPEAVS